MRIIAPLLSALMLVGPLRVITLPSPVDQVAAQEDDGCGLMPREGRVVQGCDLRSAGLRELEQQTINDLLAAHQLPLSDYQTLISWEPDAIRAALFASIVTMALKDPGQRTAQEQSIVAAMAELVRARRVAAAQFSVDEYTKWSLGPCDYAAPAGFTYDISGACYTPIGGVFVQPRPPSLQEFLAYGNAHTYADFLEGGSAAMAAGDAARLIGLVAGLVAAGSAAAIGAVVGASLTVTSALIAAIHPFLAASVAGSNSAAAIAAVAGASAGGVGAASLAALVGIIVTALVIAIIRIITVFEDAAIPGQLQDNLTAAQAPVDLAQLALTDEGKTEIFMAFLLETLPDFPDIVPPPASDDPTFILTSENGTQTRSKALQFVCWNPGDCGAHPRQSVRLSGGWFVARGVSDAAGSERMALGIDYIDWDGQAWTAWRIGPHEFLHTRTGDGAVPFVSEEIRYVDSDGTATLKFIARINKAPSAPGQPVASTSVNNGVFQLTWGASTDADGDAVSYTLARVVPPTCEMFCFETVTIIASGLTTAHYAFTSSAPELPGSWTYRVWATDGDASTPSAADSGSVLVDNRPPVIFFQSRTDANTYGWNNADVTITWTCVDTNIDVSPPGPGEVLPPPDPNGPPVSGVVAESVSQTLSSEGADQSATGVCEDLAGNQTSASVGGINIDKTPPVSAHTGPYTAEEGETITLDGSASSDALSGIASSAWSVDRDDTFDDGDPSTFTPPDGPAVYDVKLRVEDKAGNVSIAGTSVTSSNLPPTVKTPVASSNSSNETATITARATFTDPGSLDTHTCQIDWGDGSAPAAGTIDDMVCTGVHTYLDDNPSETVADEYTITFTVKDDDGDSGQSTLAHTVNNVAPTITTVGSETISDSTPQTSLEQEQVTARATFTDPGSLDTHTCQIDWGDGSAPTSGAIEDMVCTGLHTYLDDGVSGTAEDEYTITFTVTDDDGGSDEASLTHTVFNVAPTDLVITSNAPIPQGQPAIINVEATDVAGDLDPLTFAFDCDDDGIYETAGAGAEGRCALDPASAVTTIGVQVSDDDLGVTTGSVEVQQTLTVCVSRMTGAISPPLANGACQSGSIALTVPGPAPLAFCASLYTGALTWSARGTCAAGSRVHIVPDDGPLNYCQSVFTGKLRYVPNGTCGAYERPGVIPG